MFPIGDIDLIVWGSMHTEILLSRGETVTSFEFPPAVPIAISWPEPKQLRIALSADLGFEDFRANFDEILHPGLLSHLAAVWPAGVALPEGNKSLDLGSWDDLKIELVTRKSHKTQPEIEIDRPRITIQMGQRVDEFSDKCEKHLKPELFEHVIRLWSDPDYCRTVLPVGRNLLIRGCA